MCCSTRVIGLPTDWPRILQIAGFSVQTEAYWFRQIGDGNIMANCTEASSGGGGNITFTLHPNIGGHAQQQHDVNAARAAILFETARALAEGGNGTIKQLSLVGACRAEAGDVSELTLAVYPDHPFLFEHLCYGFRQTLMRGVPQEDV